MYICAIRICTCTYIHVCVSIARSILQTIHRLRWPLAQQVWSGGMGLVFLLHVQADVAIFLLVWIEDRRKARLVDATD